MDYNVKLKNNISFEYEFLNGKNIYFKYKNESLDRNKQDGLIFGLSTEF